MGVVVGVVGMGVVVVLEEVEEVVVGDGGGGVGRGEGRKGEGGRRVRWEVWGMWRRLKGGEGMMREGKKAWKMG
ncbi:hypothetical protein, partial [Kocuria rhizophila]|uniref:hypothetical protein n=1 Tax=Kocuria rhizophila TaxID=72000 RepID=UPI001642B009